MSDFGNDEAMKLPSFGVFCAQIVKDLIYFRRNAAISFDVLIKQIYFTGVEALGLCTLLSLLLGAVIIVEGHQILAAIGQTDWIYKILIFALVRDLGPFIICLVVVARSGTAISTELGNMKVNKEIMNRILNLLIPVLSLISGIKTVFHKASAVLTAGLYTAMAMMMTIEVREGIKKTIFFRKKS